MKKVDQPNRMNQAPQLNQYSISVRAFHRFYLVAVCLLNLTALACLSFDRVNEGVGLMILGCVVVPLLARMDRFVFDGTAITRTGPVGFVRNLVGNQRFSLHYAEIEVVETEVVRTLRHNGAARYQYRTKISSQNLRCTIASGGRSHRLFVNHLFRLIAPAKLDARSAELRDYLCDEKTLRFACQSLQIASPEVLENTIMAPPHARRRFNPSTRSADSLADEVRARRLQLAANKLRIAGRLSESGEAFRRALLAMPHDAALIYDFARYLFSAASMNNSAALIARSNAALRLAARRAIQRGDSQLLSRIGESLAERGELQLAAKMFQRALEIEPHAFRALIGLAEIALRSAKLAHVVHHYSAAARVAPDAAMRRFAQREADYFERLDNDDDFLNAEVRRISLLQNMRQIGSNAARVTLMAISFASVLMLFDETFAVAAWSLAAAASLAWVGVTASAKLFTNRSRVISNK